MGSLTSSESSEPVSQTSYIYGDERQGWTRVTYGTSSGTSYDYTPPKRSVDAVEALDPSRPLSVDEDL